MLQNHSLLNSESLKFKKCVRLFNLILPDSSTPSASLAADGQVIVN